MDKFEELNSEKIYGLVVRCEKTKEQSEALYCAMDKAFIRSMVVEAAAQYDIGTVTEVYEIFGGYVNRSFGICAIKDGKVSDYFVRLYKRGVAEKEIRYEHALVEFAKAHGLAIAAGIIRTREGKSYLARELGQGEKAETRYLALYEFLDGEDKYSWIEQEWNHEECASAAEVMASFHNGARNFDPQGLERVEPKIRELIPSLKGIFQRYADSELKDKFTEYFHKNLDSIMAEIDRIIIPQNEYEQMATTPIHCDFHPGNLKWKDNKAVGIFDFDWSKLDIRIFDLGLGMAYCCCSWIDELDGTLNLEECEIFLKAYQNKLQELGELSPLNDAEKKHISTMLAAGNMYLIYWATRDYYVNNDGSMNVYEYLTYLQHQVKLMNWIRNHAADLDAIAQRL